MAQEDKLDHVLATVISNNLGKGGSVRIRLVNLLYDQHFKDEPWRKNYYWKYGTMSKYFRSNSNFVFHRVGAGRHLVSINPDFKFEKVDLTLPEETGVVSVGGESSTTGESGEGIKKVPLGEHEKTASVNDKTKFFEEKGGKIQEEENRNLRKQLLSYEKQCRIRENTIKKQEKELIQLKLQLEEKNRIVAHMLQEIKLLKEGGDSSSGRKDEEDTFVDEDEYYDDDDDIPQGIQKTKDYESRKCELIEPATIQDFKKGEINHFKVKCPGAEDVAVISDDVNWCHLKKEEDDVFEGDVKIESYTSFLDILANWDKAGKFVCLISVNVVE